MSHRAGWAVGLLAGIGVAGPALAERAMGDGWAQSPTASDWKAATPASAKPGLLLRAVIRCSVEPSGALSACRAIREMPSGSGAGAAALGLTSKFRRDPPGQKGLKEVTFAADWYEFDVPADWKRRPTASDLLAVFPTEAYKNGTSGYAVIDCVVTLPGALNDCVAVHEAPADQGFGAAAIALTPQFTMKPASLKGIPVVSTVRVPIRFSTSGPGEDLGSKRVLPPNLAWAEAPTYLDVAAAFPAKARAERITGRATLSCGMSVEGRLTHCETATSLPKGYGFDVAAKALAKKFRYPITSEKDRKATREVTVHLPVTFDAAMLDLAAAAVGKPSWAAIPTADRMRSVFGPLATTKTVRVQLSCTVQAGGSLDHCTVASEEPAAVGAGAAALSLTPLFRMTTWTVDGLPTVGGTVRIPLRYEPPPPLPPSTPPAGH